MISTCSFSRYQIKKWSLSGKRKKLTGFSNAEEEAAGLTQVMPFLLETSLVDRGGVYSKAGLWQNHVVVDERLVTGQNPASAEGVGKAVAQLIGKLQK